MSIWEDASNPNSRWRFRKHFSTESEKSSDPEDGGTATDSDSPEMAEWRLTFCLLKTVH